MILHDDTVIPTKPTVPVYDNNPGRNWTIPARSGWMGIDDDGGWEVWWGITFQDNC